MSFMATNNRRRYAIITTLVVVIVSLVLSASALAILTTRGRPDQPGSLNKLLYSTLFDSDDFHHPLPLARQDIVDPPSGDLPAPGRLNASSLGHGPGGPYFDGPYTFYCGIFNTGMPATIREGAMSLREVNFTYTLAASTCQRVFCYDTSAVYVCNNNVQSPSATIAGYDIGWMADRLSLLCCDAHHASSAQLFHPTAGWNTVVGYGNCRHDPAEPPSAYGTSNGGVNGNCIPSESRPSPGTGDGGDTATAVPTGAAAAFSAAIEARADDNHSVDTRTSMPQLVNNMPPSAFTGGGGTFKDDTIRQTVHISIGALRIRVQICNTFGGSDLPAVGKVGITTPKGQIAYSDPIDYKVEALSMPTVNLFREASQSGSNITGHPGSRTSTWMQSGNHLNATTVTGSSTKHWYYVNAVEPDKLVSKYDSGDHLHPNVAGYQYLADNFLTDLFK